MPRLDNLLFRMISFDPRNRVSSMVSPMVFLSCWDSQMCLAAAESFVIFGRHLSSIEALATVPAAAFIGTLAAFGCVCSHSPLATSSGLMLSFSHQAGSLPV